MAAAAAVPLSRTNDAEFTVTLSSCGSVSEWVDAFLRHPDAAGVTNLRRSDAPLYLTVACGFGPTTLVCKEGYSTGYIAP
jgi:hypothetical protein